MTREGYLVEEQGVTYVADAHGIIDPDNLLAPLQAASCTYRIALGPRAGRKVLSLQHAASRAAPMTYPLCANAHGFSLHAGVRCEAEQRSELEQLCRYITRPAIATGSGAAVRSVSGGLILERGRVRCRSKRNSPGRGETLKTR